MIVPRELGFELRFVHERRRLRVGKDVFDLGPAKARADRHHDGPDARRGEHGHDGLEAVGEHDRDAIAFADAARGKPCRQPVGLPVELPIGQPG